MDLMDGDYIEYYIENGEVIIRKLTKLYPGGLDLEGEDIKERLFEYELTHGKGLSDEDADPEKTLQMAREQYRKDLEARRAAKNKSGLKL